MTTNFFIIYHLINLSIPKTERACTGVQALFVTLLLFPDKDPCSAVPG